MNWEALKQSTLEEVLAWAEAQPWAKAMADCAQDAEWHAEGDVWTHTKMVCRRLEELEEWPTLLPDEQTVLIFTALFHDSAKPATTQVDPETGRVRSPKHSIKGEGLARVELRRLNCDLPTREHIAKLVRYHGRPAFLLERREPQHEVARMSWYLNNRLLYLFALADTRGRLTESMNRPEENLQYWKLQAEELDCFDRPFPFVSPAARLTFFRSREPNLFYAPHTKASCTVTIMSGLPGSGKDTWLRRHRPETPLLSLDELRTELQVEATDNQGRVSQLALERAREHLRSGTSFAFNATNLLRQTRARWVELCLDYGAHIEQVYIEPPLDQILQQNRERRSPVPERVIHKLAGSIEPPTWDETHALVLVDGR